MKNGLNAQEMKYCKKKILWNVWEIIDKKIIWKLCDIIIWGLHFDRILRINYEKCVEKYDDQWYLSLLLNTYNY